MLCPGDLWGHVVAAAAAVVLSGCGSGGLRFDCGLGAAPPLSIDSGVRRSILVGAVEPVKSGYRLSVQPMGGAGFLYRLAARGYPQFRGALRGVAGPLSAVSCNAPGCQFAEEGDGVRFVSCAGSNVPIELQVVAPGMGHLLVEVQVADRAVPQYLDFLGANGQLTTAVDQRIRFEPLMAPPP